MIRFMRLIPAAACALGVASLVSAPALAQTVEPPFDQFYTLVNLGSPPNVPGSLGGLILKHNDPNTLLIGGAANGANGALYEVPLVRTCGKITGFAGSGVRVSDAPNNDGGIVYAPNGTLLFTRYNINHLGQTLPGSGLMDKSVDLTAPGIAPSVGTCQFVPPGMPGAGQFKVASYNAGLWYTVGLVPDGAGTFNIGAVSPPVTAAFGPEGIVFIRAGSPQFPTHSALISEYTAGVVSAYELDANGDPIPSTRRPFITGLSGAEGAHIDAETGDFLFSTFGGGDRVIVVRGFNDPCAGDANNDNRIDFSDLNLVLSNFGQSFPGIPGDVNNDCTVNFTDLNIVLGRFGIVCAI